MTTLIEASLEGVFDEHLLVENEGVELGAEFRDLIHEVLIFKKKEGEKEYRFIYQKGSRKVRLGRAPEANYYIEEDKDIKNWDLTAAPINIKLEAYPLVRPLLSNIIEKTKSYLGICNETPEEVSSQM